MIIALGIWEAAILIWKFPAFILPGPGLVAVRFSRALIDGSLFSHFLITLFEVIMGLVIGAGFATILGYLLAKSPASERFLSPYLVASQAIPLVAIAPLMIIWFGPGLFSKILICSLIVFFPILINTIVGIRAVPDTLRDLMRSLHASKWQTLHLLEVPAALPVFLGGLRVGATLSVIGAVVGEFVGSDRGLGFLINVGRGQYDTALVFAAIFTLVALALGLYYAVVLVEKRMLKWNKVKDEH
jgi:NitT/TauT family transport system permease protein